MLPPNLQCKFNGDHFFKSSLTSLEGLVHQQTTKNLAIKYSEKKKPKF